MIMKKFIYASAGALLAATATSPAWAGTVYQESDYSYVTNTNTRPTICDREADARTAYSNGTSIAGNSNTNTRPTVCDKEADARTAYSNGTSIAGNSFRVNDQDGSSGSCWYVTISSGVRNHRTCEDINNWPDACSGYSNH